MTQCTANVAFCCRFNRSMQHPLIVPDAEVRIWGECTDVFHAEAEGSAKNANGLMRQYFPANRFLAFLSGVPE